MDLGLVEQRVLITGAAGGIGAALARAFRREGAWVAAHLGRPPVPPGDEAREAPPGPGPWTFRADVRDPDAMQRWVDRVIEGWGRLDAVVINAGVWPEADVPLRDLDPARAREVLEVNLLGALWTARGFLRGLARTGPRPGGPGASVLFIGSTAGRFGEAGHVDYAASKAALRGVVASLKNEIVEIDPLGRVNLLEPGWTATPMAQGALGRDDQVRRALQTMALARVATPGDIAAAALVLVSPVAGRHVSGEVLTVAGGMEGRVLRPPEAVDPEGVRGDAAAGR